MRWMDLTQSSLLGDGNTPGPYSFGIVGSCINGLHWGEGIHHEWTNFKSNKALKFQWNVFQVHYALNATWLRIDPTYSIYYISVSFAADNFSNNFKLEISLDNIFRKIVWELPRDEHYSCDSFGHPQHHHLQRNSKVRRIWRMILRTRDSRPE